MDHKIIPTFLSVVFVMAVLYALIMMTPLEKIDFACKPFTTWPGTLMSAAIRVGDPATARKFDQAVDRGFNGCRRWLWIAFYQERYERLKAEETRGNQSGSAK